MSRCRSCGIPDDQIQGRFGYQQDHLPMTEPDWVALTRLLNRVYRREIPEPWTATFEYGGVGPLWEAVTDAATLRAQIPRLSKLVKSV